MRVNPTNIIYLYILKYSSSLSRLNEISDNKLQTMSYVFCEFLNTNSNLVWNRTFYLFEEYALDKDYQNVLATLAFHGFIDNEDNLTERGEEYLSLQLSNNPIVKNLLTNYFNNYSEHLYLKSLQANNIMHNSSDDYHPLAFL